MGGGNGGTGGASARTGSGGTGGAVVLAGSGGTGGAAARAGNGGTGGAAAGSGAKTGGAARAGHGGSGGAPVRDSIGGTGGASARGAAAGIGFLSRCDNGRVITHGSGGIGGARPGSGNLPAVAALNFSCAASMEATSAHRYCIITLILPIDQRCAAAAYAARLTGV